MGATLGREADAVGFLAALAAAPYRYDFYQALRLLECFNREQPRWGAALRPAEEPVRLGQEPSLSFAPAAIAALETGPAGRPRLSVNFAGLLGANGPLPLHMTEYVRERLRNSGDATFSAFLDIFHHRFLALLYRAWAQAQPHVNCDRPESDLFAVSVGALAGIAPSRSRHRDALPPTTAFFHVTTLVRGVRSGAGLAAILEQFFGVRVVVEEFTGHWLRLGVTERTTVGRLGASLGLETVLGERVWDRQDKFRLRFGPLALAEYEKFLPGGVALEQLADWLRLYLCFELDWDVCLVLAKGEAPPLRLGSGARLGWTSWLGSLDARDRDNLCLDAERFVPPPSTENGVGTDFGELQERITSS
jgi:type VI secretion system protein ImpH